MFGFAMIAVSQPVMAQSATTLASAAGDHQINQSVERMDLIVKSSRILSLGERIPRFQVHNEEVLGATPVSENQIQVFGKTPGTTQINLWDTEDKLYTIDVTVVADAREVEGILNSQLPLASLRVTPIGESSIISGYVTSVDDVDKAVAITEQFYTTVINNIQVVGIQQVLLHTKIMEISRTKLRQLGVDLAILSDNFVLLNGPSGILDVSAGLVEGDNGTFGPVPVGDTNLRFNVNGDFEAMIKALEEQRMVKLLAEPTVVATHGRPARFTVGGRIPTIIPGQNGQVQVSYEDYGTSIDFLPFVVGPGRIRLEVRPEVSEPDSSRAITLDGTNVTAFTTRYVETAVEMQAGQTFALAGLLQSRTESTVSRTPFFGSLPYVGSLFRQMQERRNEIELLIMVTPELVEAMDPHEVPRGGPGMNTHSPDDKEFYALGHIEVPNLKANDCDNTNLQPGITSGFRGGQIESGPMLHQPPMYQSPMNGVPSQGYQEGQIVDPMLPSPQASRSTPPRSTPNPAGYYPPQMARAPQRPANNRFGAGELLPPGAIVPGPEPTKIADGVIVSQPEYR
ncbi:Type II/IV secretion system secretin RcpA/CpaC, associated with Flp pilus assembly [Rhodopirellula islandica]|uniref:Type II/IV secretion system secretin RcpA/CpaC, associated with Flp pilus assembly n=1 Tax=Rhodopirellula islandica TaxID=595434 RepID=A0A0J1BJ12_RHOIS|nr:Type II/IV secretion system secretin RcpA/CpaC, associated with Flp pilus assembly [Rhodopirellula islandica]